MPLLGILATLIAAMPPAQRLIRFPCARLRLVLEVVHLPEKLTVCLYTRPFPAGISGQPEMKKLPLRKTKSADPVGSASSSPPQARGLC